MIEKNQEMISSGSVNLDKLLQGLCKGDNVVWQVDREVDYAYFADLFARQTIHSGKGCVYLRFAAGSPVLSEIPGLKVIEMDPAEGFDAFSRKAHDIIEEYGKHVYFVFDNLSALVETWATDELLADFYQVTCPYIYELGSIAYFSLTRDLHDYTTIARIKTTTQILISVYFAGGKTYIHPLKVWKRYSPHMFLTHEMTGDNWTPVTASIDAAAVLAITGKHLVHTLPDSDSPWNSVFKKLVQYKEDYTDDPKVLSEMAALKTELTRMMFGDHEKLNQLADRYLAVDDVINIRRRLIGSGRIGGKSAGMLLARSVLAECRGETDFSNVLEKHDSFYIGSDVFFSFLVKNNLFRLRLNLSKNPELSPEDFIEVEQAFTVGQFPEETIEQFRDMLEYFGQAPIIVRSSSLLEDGFEHAYAGKYRSEFCANQGSPDERLEKFLKAVKLVYASALNPDVLSYRKKMGITEGDEQMAILVQRVSGMPFKNYFFPTLAGVAFSHNLYAWTDRINPDKGMIRFVFGLGTRAVNRTGRDYTRIAAVSHPWLRPEPSSQIFRYSQKNVDLIDLAANQFSTESVDSVFAGSNYPNLHLLAASVSEGYQRNLSYLEGWQKGYSLTFSELIKRTRFVAIMDEMLTCLEEAWGRPVDIEFTAHIDDSYNITYNLLQCRSLRMPKLLNNGTDLLDNISQEQILFKSGRAIGVGVVDNIRYIIYVDPVEYNKLKSVVSKKSLGRIIGRLNQSLASTREKIMLMGPGRWGSSNIDLGINVSFADIANVSVLVEIASEETGYDPEISYGTHFFLDLVEAEIIYLPLYPDEEGACFNSRFFSVGSGILAGILPEYAEYNGVIRVIDVTAVSKSAYARLVADPQEKTAICYLSK